MQTRRSLPVLGFACLGYCLGFLRGYRLGYLRACRDFIRTYTRSLGSLGSVFSGR